VPRHASGDAAPGTADDARSRTAADGGRHTADLVPGRAAGRRPDLGARGAGRRAAVFDAALGWGREAVPDPRSGTGIEAAYGPSAGIEAAYGPGAGIEAAYGPGAGPGFGPGAEAALRPPAEAAYGPGAGPGFGPGAAEAGFGPAAGLGAEQDADYGIVISLDAQGSSGLPDPDRPALRERIYRVAELAFEQARIAGARLVQEDRGDGIIAVVRPRVAARVAGEWTEYLHQNLRAVNRELRRPLRLRAGLAVGPFRTDAHGFSGGAVDLACRIGNCAEAKAVLDAAPGAPLLVAVSDRLYQDVIRHGGRWIEPGHYRPFDVSLQEGPQRPWFMVAGRTAPPLPEGGGSAASGDDADSAPHGAGERWPVHGTDPADAHRTPRPGPGRAPGPHGPADRTGRDHGDGREDRTDRPGFHFGPVTHHGSGQVLQGQFGDLTFDNRQGGGASDQPSQGRSRDGGASGRGAHDDPWRDPHDPRRDPHDDPQDRAQDRPQDRPRGGAS
jgi:hypothetical protein